MTAGYSASGLHVVFVVSRACDVPACLRTIRKAQADDVDTSAERANTNAEWLRDGTQSLQRSSYSSNDLPVSRSQIALMDQSIKCAAVTACWRLPTIELILTAWTKRAFCM